MQIKHSLSLFETLLDISQAASPLVHTVSLCRLGKGASSSRHLTAICWKMVVISIRISDGRAVMASPRVVHAQWPESRHLLRALISPAPFTCSHLTLQGYWAVYAPNAWWLRMFRETESQLCHMPAVKFLTFWVQSVSSSVEKGWE